MQAKRQFIWIMTDTTRYDMLGCYGNERMHTPHLDSMAAKGMRFERAYTTQPVCGPARSALFTGQFPHSNGSWSNSMPLGADVLTLGQRLCQEGIHCGYIGKWHLDAGDYFGNGVCPDGWDPSYWHDMRNYLDELTAEERLRSRSPLTAFEGDGIDATFTYAHRCTERALRFLAEHWEDDFLLILSYDEPHDPYLCPPPFTALYDGSEMPPTPAHYDTLEGKPDLQRLWAKGQEAADRDTLPSMNRMLCCCNSFVDSEIGRLLAEIETNLPGAMSLYTSDHGDASNAHCLSGKGPAVYDEIARIPLLFMGAGVPAGRVYPHTVSHIDLPATVMDYMGLPIPKVFEGESLLPQVTGDDDATGRPAFVEFGRYEIDHDGFGGFQPMRAVIDDAYKLALHLLDMDELYDIAKDPYELRNVIAEEAYAPVRNGLHDQILDWMNRTRDPFRGYQWKCRPWRSEYAPSWDVDGYTRQRENEPGAYRQLDYSTGLTMEETVRKK